MVQALSGKLDKAIVDFNQAIKLKPRNAVAFYNRGVTYARKRQYDKAIADFSEAIKLNPRHPNAYRNRGIAYALKKQFNKALEDLQKAQRLGVRVNPKILDQLKQAAGKTR